MAVVTATHAHSQSAYDQPGSFEPSFSPSARIGGGVVVKPKYEGSGDHEVIGFPLTIPNFSSEEPSSLVNQLGKRVSFKSIDDIRFRAFEWNQIELGPVAGYRTGREESDGQRLGGLGDFDDGLVVGGYVGVRMGQILFDASVTTPVTGDDSGVIVRAGGEVSHDLTPLIQLTTRLGTTFADDQYAQTFFGISATQAGQSTVGLGTYNADAGLKDVHVDLGARVDLSDRWRLQLGGRYARLVGDAADSPIVETKDQVTGRMSIGYKFHLNTLR